MNKLSKYVIINVIIAILFTLLYTFLTVSILFIVILGVLCALFYVFCEINIYKYKLMGLHQVHQKKRNRNWGVFFTIINVLCAFVIIKSANNHYGAEAYYTKNARKTNDDISFTVKHTNDKDSLALIIAAHVPFNKVDSANLQRIIRDIFTIPNSKYVIFMETLPNPDIDIELYNYTTQSQPMKRLLFSIDVDGIINNTQAIKKSKFINQEIIWQYINVSDSLGY